MVFLSLKNNFIITSVKFLIIIFYLICLIEFNLDCIRLKALNINSNVQNFSLDYELHYSHKYDYFNINFTENYLVKLNIEFENSTNQSNGTIEYYLDKNITYSKLVNLFTLYLSGAPKAYLANHLENETFITYFFNRIESQEKQILDNSTYVNFWVENSIEKTGDEEKFFLHKYPVSIQVNDISKIMRKKNQWDVWNFFTPNIKTIFNTYHFYFESSATSFLLEIHNYYELETRILIFSDIIYKELHPVGEEIHVFKVNLVNWTTNLFPPFSYENIFWLYFSIISIACSIIGCSILTIILCLHKLKQRIKKSEYDKIQL